VRAGIGRRSGDLAALWQNRQLRARHERCRAAKIEFQECRKIDGFWPRADRSSGQDSCWLWMGTVGGEGYGIFRLGDERLAHRISFVVTNGPIAKGVKILHGERCPRRCVNPAHLRAGSQRENMEDKRRHGRARGGPRFGRGELNNRAKYSPIQVEVAREMRTERYTLRDIAVIPGITYRSLENIFRGATWAFSTPERPL
jgi:hypothetical protein